jgi:hypothetical protein
MAIRTAGKNGNWSDPTVWSGSRVPSSGDTANLGGFSVTLDTPAIPATGSLNKITNDPTTGGALVYGTPQNITINGDVENAKPDNGNGLGPVLNLVVNQTAVINGQVRQIANTSTGQQTLTISADTSSGGGNSLITVNATGGRPAMLQSGNQSSLTQGDFGNTAVFLGFGNSGPFQNNLVINGDVLNTGINATAVEGAGSSTIINGNARNGSISDATVGAQGAAVSFWSGQAGGNNFSTMIVRGDAVNYANSGYPFVNYLPYSGAPTIGVSNAEGQYFELGGNWDNEAPSDDVGALRGYFLNCIVVRGNVIGRHGAAIKDTNSSGLLILLGSAIGTTVANGTTPCQILCTNKIAFNASIMPGQIVIPSNSILIPTTVELAGPLQFPRGASMNDPIWANFAAIQAAISSPVSGSSGGSNMALQFPQGASMQDPLWNNFHAIQAALDG